MEMKPEDYYLAMACLNATTSLCAAVIIAWTRHGQAEDDGQIEPSRVVQFVYKMDADYISIRERDDLLTEMDKQRVAKMIQDGNALSFRCASVYGFTRAGWNKVRYGLTSLGVAEVRQQGGLVLLSSAFPYLRIAPPHQLIAPLDRQYPVNFTPRVDTRAGGGVRS